MPAMPSVGNGTDAKGSVCKPGTWMMKGMVGRAGVYEFSSCSQDAFGEWKYDDLRGQKLQGFVNQPPPTNVTVAHPFGTNHGCEDGVWYMVSCADGSVGMDRCNNGGYDMQMCQRPNNPAPAEGQLAQ